jgi:hypothetical protein
MAVDAARFIYLVSQQPGFAMLVMEALSNRQRGTATEFQRPTSVTPISQKLNETIAIDENCFQLRSRARSGNAYLQLECRGRLANTIISTFKNAAAKPVSVFSWQRAIRDLVQLTAACRSKLRAQVTDLRLEPFDIFE